VSAVVYKHFTKEEMELNFNPQAAVPDHARWSAERRKASLRVRATLRAHLDVPYGDSPRQRMDIFPAGNPAAPVFFYIHGGYWRGGGKEDNCHLAELFTKAGATVAVMEYDLCPNVTVTEIVRQTRAAIAWTYHHIADYGGDPSNIHICGLSAGGHLVAMSLARDWKTEKLPRDPIKGAVAVSGVYDLDAVLHLDLNREIRLTPESARENSPFLHPPLACAPLIVAAGEGEPEGWRRMSEDFFRLCRERGVECRYIEVPEAHHYSLSSHLAEPASPLTRAILRQMGLSTPAGVQV
jgi:arylformamidase